MSPEFDKKSQGIKYGRKAAVRAMNVDDKMEKECTAFSYTVNFNYISSSLGPFNQLSQLFTGKKANYYPNPSRYEDQEIKDLSNCKEVRINFS